MDFKNRVVAVFGGEQPLAQSYARRVAQLGATVVIHSSDGVVTQSLAEELSGTGTSVQAYSGPLANSTQTDAIFAEIVATYGKVDSLLNVVGSATACNAQSLSDDSLSETMEACFMAPLRTSRSVVPYMQAQGYGRIVNVTSGIGLFGAAGRSAYAAASAATAGFSKSLALEVKDKNVKVNLLAPFAIDLDQADSLLPSGEADMVAPVLAYLSHECCDLTGEVITVGRGRISRIFSSTASGYMNYAPDIEAILENLGEIRGTKYAVIPLRAEDEMLLVDV